MAARPAVAPAILCENVVKIYKVADLEVVALQGLDLAVDSGELIAVVGASGSGKSTLQNILGAVDLATAGHVEVAGHDLAALTERERTLYRRQVVGFVWQQTSRNLLPYLTAAENVELPMSLNGIGLKRREARAAELLKLVGLGARMRNRADTLSGGEQQRVAVATALANNPSVLLADEPTGELDSDNAGQLFETLRLVSRDLGVTIVVFTHDPLVSEQVQRTVEIRDGRTSMETLRRIEQGPEGEERLVAEELAVLDRAGRLQLPREYVTALALERRVRLVLEGDHVRIWPDRRNGAGDGD
ncbi:MAG TPA: ABC transporter ATP-binding protein [Gaiellaceae bacterium]|nr:ABC transporter ATP-binding protein [Gaiellaceae bacterium]